MTAPAQPAPLDPAAHMTPEALYEAKRLAVQLGETPATLIVVGLIEAVEHLQSQRDELQMATIPVSEVLRLAQEWERMTEDLVAKNVTGSIMLKVMRARAKDLRALAEKHGGRHG